MRARSTLAIVATTLALAACSPRHDGPPLPPPPGAACLAIDSACDSGTQCCSASCTLGMCDCSPLSKQCTSSADCCEDFYSARKCQAATCVSGCRSEGDVCTWDYECCSSNCDATNHCAPPCLSYGAACTSSNQCCQYFGCPAGTCSGACSTSSSCTTSNQCCSGYGCRAGLCQLGACGTSGQRCNTAADCCDVAHGGKNYRCEGTPGYTTCTLSQVAGTCATDADCASNYPCRDGYCHYPDATRNLGEGCLDGPECKSGICTSTTPGQWGTCCGGPGATCTAGIVNRCCAPLACVGTPGAQSCGGCLGPDNSGPGHALQCTTYTQCCTGQSLTCDTSDGKCCKQRGQACTDLAQCCAGDDCAGVTTSGQTQTLCCGTYQAACSLGGYCCDGYRCTSSGNSSACLKGPGQPCTASAECATSEGCRIPTPPTGACCLHWASCTDDAQCCSGVCSSGYCVPAPSYGTCLDDSDCVRELNTSYAGPLCGGNDTVGPLRCCPAPGQTCASAADCCEAGDDCQVPLDPYIGTAAICCRGIQASCAQDYECCTGGCRNGVPGDRKCCAFAFETSFVCASDADCCEAGNPSFSMCKLDATPHPRCCYKAGWHVGTLAASAEECCSGRVDGWGDCR